MQKEAEDHSLDKQVQDFLVLCDEVAPIVDGIWKD